MSYRPYVRDEPKMHVGCQSFQPTKVDMEFLIRCGVSAVDMSPLKYSGEGQEDGVITLETLRDYAQKTAEFGVTLEAIHIPLPRCITLALPERDDAIAQMCETVKNAGLAGIRACMYNFCVLPHQRTAAAKGRGGTTLSTFNLVEYDNETLSEAGVVKKPEVLRRAK
jgi:D-mannonate dehydratase